MSFEDNKKLYEQENADTVDVLFTMINFDAFKKKMIVAKKGMSNDLNNKSNAADENHFKKVDIDEQWKLFQNYTAESINDKTIGWQKKVDQSEFKNGFKVMVH